MSDTPLSIEDILAEATPTERSVRICIRGDLRARFDELEAELRAAVDGGDGERSVSGAPEHAIVERLQQVRADMEAATRTFRFRSIGKRWRTLATKHEKPDGGMGEGFFVEAIAESSVSPKMSVEQVGKLFDVLAQGDVDALFLCARSANLGTPDLPKSRLASEILARPGRSES
jgi:hypothetical protein